MGFALGWIAVTLAGMSGATPNLAGAAPISYTVRMVEAQGIGWREGVMAHLKPVTRQGATTVWTMPAHAVTTLFKDVEKNPACQVMQAPRVTSFGGVPATIQCRANQELITQVSWNGDEIAPEGAPEKVRLGWHTTFLGRKLDQGILVKLVFEDTHIRAVHQVKLSRLNGSCCAQSPQPAKSEAQVTSGAKNVFVFVAIPPAGKSPFDGVDSNKADTRWSAYELDPAKSPLNVPDLKEGCMDTEVCCQARDSAKQDAKAQTVALDVPEIGSQEVAGEWLIPNGECLLLSFGAYTVADKDGKAVVKERLAIIEAEETTELADGAPPPYPPAALYLPAPSGAVGPPPMPSPPAPQPPGFGPTARPEFNSPPLSAESFGPIVPGGQFLLPSVTAPFVPNAAPVPVAPTAKMPMPAAPDRSLPQGFHSDGRKADLPPLPADEMDADSADSESAEPLASPQTKKPQKPKPATDAGTTKASLPQHKLSFTFRPGEYLPSAVEGFQFLMPLKPLSLKLPFNQKLELELRGRVVPATP